MAALTIKVIRVYEGEGETWRVQCGESGEVLGISPDKEDAVEMARRSAQEGGAMLVVETPDGRVDWAEEYEWGEHVFDPHDPEAAKHTVIRVVSVVEGEGNCWLVEGDEAHEILGSTLDRSEAINIGRRTARSRHAHLIVHLENGSIEWTEDYACAAAER